MSDLVVYDEKALTAAEVVAQVRLIQEVMEGVMKEGTHYGTIPGCKLPSLYKAGSEILLATFRYSVEPEIEDLSGPDEIRYRVKTIGRQRSGVIVGVGVGECSSREEKYHWKKAFNDKEYEVTPEDRRRLKWKRYGNKEYQEKQVRTNPADVANTILKIAKKRSQIDLTLTATAASDIFIQDLEDMPDEIRVGVSEAENAKPPIQEPKEKAPEPDKAKLATDSITEHQIKKISVLLANLGIKDDYDRHAKVSEIIGEGETIESIKNLTKKEASAVIEALDAEAKKKETPL